MRRSVVAWVACVAGVLLVSVPAGAADVMAPKAGFVEASSYRWYLELRAGAPIQQDYDVVVGGGIGAGEYRPATGWHAAIAGGVQFSPNWRAELHVSYSNGQDGDLRLTAGGAPIPHSGNVNVYTISVDGIYTFTTLSPHFQPFIGAGVGVAIYELRNHGAVGGAFVSHGSDTTPVLGLHLGVDVPLGRVVTATARYTLAHTGSLSFNSIPAGIVTTRGSTIDHIFSAGLRVFLN